MGKKKTNPLKGFKFLKLPKSMNEAKNICRKLCSLRNVEDICFDDKWGNFGSDWNRCICAGNSIDCSRFNDWNYDLLLFSVMHELGHIHYGSTDSETKPSNHCFKNGFCREYDCWQYAINLWLETFGQNISVKMGWFMVDSLSTYLPEYNPTSRNYYNEIGKDYRNEVESSFWCPLKTKVIRN